MRKCVFTLCDDNYSEPCKVMLTSFLMNNSWFDGDIVILYDSLSENNMEKIKIVSDKILFYEVNKDNKYDLFIKNKKLPTASTLIKCYYKFEVFNNFFSDKYDCGLWLDSDIVVRVDISEIFNADCDFAWCEDRISKNGEYCNSGVFMFSYDKLKGDGFYSTLFEFGKKPIFKRRHSGNGRYADQDVLNEIVFDYFDNVKILNKNEYNETKYGGSDYKNAKIIHYCGGEKPFLKKNGNIYDSYYLWYYYYYVMKSNEELVKC
jgi:lipopolysaccharide biosynthesis glycosyltransferase